MKLQNSEIAKQLFSHAIKNTCSQKYYKVCFSIKLSDQKNITISYRLFLVSNCLYNKLAIAGSDFRQVSSVISASYCQYLCQQEPKCLFFTYEQNTGLCWLKSAMTNIASGELRISGPKFCSKRGISTLLYTYPKNMSSWN